MKLLLRLNLALPVFLVNLSAQTLSRYVRTNRSEATIEVRVGEKSPFRVPRTQYGTFLEDIGYSVFGGVSAQILDNPSLEDYSASLDTLKERFPNDAFRQASALGLPRNFRKKAEKVLHEVFLRKQALYQNLTWIAEGSAGEICQVSVGITRWGRVCSIRAFRLPSFPQPPSLHL